MKTASATASAVQPRMRFKVGLPEKDLLLELNRRVVATPLATRLSAERTTNADRTVPRSASIGLSRLGAAEFGRSHGSQIDNHRKGAWRPNDDSRRDRNSRWLGVEVGFGGSLNLGLLTHLMRSRPKHRATPSGSHYRRTMRTKITMGPSSSPCRLLYA